MEEKISPETQIDSPTATTQSPDPSIQPLPTSKRGANIVILLLVAILALGVLVSGIGFLVLQRSNQKSQPEPTATIPTPTPEAEKITAPEEEELAPGQKRYTSSELGVTFLYLENQNDQTVAVKEEGDKVYVYIKEFITDGKKDNYLGGQWIEIFSKDPSQSLEDAIKEKFLTGYRESDCFVSPYTSQSSSPYPSSFETAVISYPPPTDESEPFWVNSEKCPAIYSKSNGMAYFLMDKNNPDRFAYLSIGQYAILSDTDSGWQNTVKFIQPAN